MHGKTKVACRQTIGGYCRSCQQNVATFRCDADHSCNKQGDKIACCNSTLGGNVAFPAPGSQGSYFQLKLTLAVVKPKLTPGQSPNIWRIFPPLLDLFTANHLVEGDRFLQLAGSPTCRSLRSAIPRAL